MHRFSWLAGIRDPEANTTAKWNVMSQWTLSDTFETIFGTAGFVTARAEARDTHGSVGAAFSQVELRKPPMLGAAALSAALGQVEKSGDPLKMLSAVNAIAGNVEPGNPEMQASLLRTMTSAMGSVDAASVETVAASSDALAGVISSFESTTSPASGAVPEQLDLDLASRAADLLGSIASSAATLEGGLSSENAGVLVNSIDAMLAAVAVRDEASTAMVYDVDPAAEALAAQKAEEDRQQQAATAERLQAAIGSTADAMLNAVDEGVEAEIDSGGGMRLKLKRQSLQTLSSSGAQLGNISLPPLPLGSGGRRLSGNCTGLAAGSVSMHHITYQGRNPFPFAGLLGGRTNTSNISNEEKPRIRSV